VSDDSAFLLSQGIAALDELVRRKNSRAALEWVPYPTQRKACQGFKPYVALFGANQAGKSLTAAHRMCWDLTGIYPDWYEGPRTHRAPQCWVVGETNETTRDSCQKLLFGGDYLKPGYGGLIPPDLIEGKPSMRHNIPGAFDTVRVKHISGGTSYVTFKSYVMGREALQAWTGDRMWVDEEPPFDCFAELQMRLVARKGLMIIAFTPLKGKSKVIDMLLDDDSPDVEAYFLTAEEAKHLGAEHIERYTRMFKHDPAMLKARLYGIPDIDSGLIYKVQLSELWIPRFQIPEKWPRIGGLDLGWTHPTAFLVAALDRASDTLFCYHEYREAKKPYYEHARALRPFTTKGIRFGTDPSAEQPDKSTGKKLIAQYNDELQPEWEYIPPMDRLLFYADNSIQPGLEDVGRRLAEGRLIFMDDMKKTRGEMENYSYTKKGKLPEEDDDLMDALRYLCRSAEKARPVSDFQQSTWRVLASGPATCLPGY